MNPISRITHVRGLPFPQAVYAFLERDFRFPSDKQLGLRSVTDQLWDLCLRMVVRHVRYARRVLADKLRQVVYRDVGAGACVKHLAFGFLGKSCSHDEVGAILHLEEVPGLGAVAKYLQRLPTQVLLHEDGDDAAFHVGLLVRPVGVEGPKYRDREPKTTVVGERELF